MIDLLKKWIWDSIEVDMKRTYRRQLELPMNVDFVDRYSDYYVNLITRVYNVLKNHNEGLGLIDQKRNELMTLARGMQFFDSELNRLSFPGINYNDNTLYVATLYYLCEYEAVAALLLKDCDCEKLSTNEARSIYYIISGGKIRSEGNVIEHIDRYLLDGDSTGLTKFLVDLSKRCEDLIFDNVDEFFDSELLLHVIRKFISDNVRADLEKYDNTINWIGYIKYSFSRNIFSLLLSQREALSKGLLNYKRSFSLQMPTSAGKTFLTELLIYQELQQNEHAKILYIAPLRSLSHELKVKYSKVSKALGFTYRCIYGGSSISLTESYLQDADMLITTPETLMSLEDAIEDLLSSFSLIICDEGQLIESTGRGLNYELLLSRFKSMDASRFLFISAIIPNIGDINTWLGGAENEVCNSKYRPCLIKYAASIVSGKAIDIGVYENPSKLQESFHIKSFVNEIECRGTKLSTQRNVAALIALKSLDAGSVMLFTSFKRGNSGCKCYGETVKKIIEENNLPSPISFINDNQRADLKRRLEYLAYQFGTDFYLTSFVAAGFCIHHGSLPQDIREIIERGYAKGSLRLLICNSTLAEGVNFPIKTLILGDIRHPDPTKRQLMAKEVLMNVIGRAGRAGEETYGLVIAPKEKFWYVSQAADADGLTPAKGMLNDLADLIMKVEQKKGRELNEEEVNKVIEKLDLSESIDRMIFRSSDRFKLTRGNPDSIATSTLTYHLAGNQKKEQLKKVFLARYVYLQKLSKEELNEYQETGLSPLYISFLNESVHSDLGLSKLSERTILNETWLKEILQMVSEREKIDNINHILQVLKLWTAGYQYREIADKLNVSIDDILVKLEFIKGNFLRMSKSIMKYICLRFNIDNDALTLWPYYVELGLNDLLQVELVKKGLSDRNALHAISSYFEINELIWFEADDIVDCIKQEEKSLMSYLYSLHLPIITCERVQTFVNVH